MTKNAMRGVVAAFCDALAARAPELLSAVIADEVELTIFGPVDLFPFFGQRRGKQAVMMAFGDLMAHLSHLRWEKDTVLVEGERAAALVRLNADDSRSGRPLSLRLALFAQL